MLVFNIPGISSLNLTREVIVGIFNGSYTYWNDSHIQEVNPGIVLPGETIVPIARADKSGSTEIFTSALASFSSQWLGTYGVFSAGLDDNKKPVVWSESAIKMFGYTQLGMTGLLMSVNYAIGYLSLEGAMETHLTFADIYNRAGTLVHASTAAVQSAMNDFSHTMTSRLTTTLVDAPGVASYPISGFTYLIIHKNREDCASSVELYRYVEWIYEDDVAHAECERLSMVPVSTAVAQMAINLGLNELKCNGQSVQQLVAEQKHEEFISMQTWRTPVMISVPIAVLLFGSMVGFIVWQQYKANMAILYEWKIPYTDIKMLVNNKTKSSSNLMKSAASFASNVGSMVDNAMLKSAKVGSRIGLWNDKTIELREINTATVLKRHSKRLILSLRDDIVHHSVAKLHGVTQVENTLYFVTEYCIKGSLGDILQNDRYNLDNNFKYCIAMDIAEGVLFLHNHGIIHGQLSSSTCNIDARWNVKITDWQYNKFNEKLLTVDMLTAHGWAAPASDDDAANARDGFWKAPEVLNKPAEPITKEADTYSFAILLVSIFTREDPFSELSDELEPADVINGIIGRNLRPKLGKEIPLALHSIIELLWATKVEKRPPFSRICKSLRAVNPSRKSMIDCMMEVVEGYVDTLEDKIEERTAALAVAMTNMQNLLHKILPPTVADKLSRGESVPPERSESVTIGFSDIVGFTTLSALSTPIQIIDLLNDLYSRFDAIIDQHDCYKVETIGDAYMVISGLPNPNGIKHADEIARLALKFVEEAKQCRVAHLPNEEIKLRMGVHSGPVAAGVVGLKMPRYCLFGDTVNTASRMESTSVAMKVQISEPTMQLLASFGNFIIEPRGEIEVKVFIIFRI